MVLSSPSGGGKTTIAKALLTARRDVAYSVSATTRPRRPEERNSVDYYFLTPDEFQAKVEAGEFLEWAAYAGYLYGTLASKIETIMESGKHAVLDIEVVGARKVRERLANVVSIFILPPSAGVLRERLSLRSTEGIADLEVRLQHAVEEVGAATEYDYVVVNADLEQAVAAVHHIIDAECQRAARLSNLGETMKELRDALKREAQSLRQ